MPTSPPPPTCPLCGSTELYVVTHVTVIDLIGLDAWDPTTGSYAQNGEEHRRSGDIIDESPQGVMCDTCDAVFDLRVDDPTVAAADEPAGNPAGNDDAVT